MTELNAASDRMVLLIDCKVKDIEGFKTWALVMNGTSQRTEVKPHL